MIPWWAAWRQRIFANPALQVSVNHPLVVFVNHPHLIQSFWFFVYKSRHPLPNLLDLFSQNHALNIHHNLLQSLHLFISHDHLITGVPYHQNSGSTRLQGRASHSQGQWDSSNRPYKNAFCSIRRLDLIPFLPPATLILLSCILMEFSIWYSGVELRVVAVDFLVYRQDTIDR